MLTDTTIKTAKPRLAAYKLADGRGLYLLVRPNGSLWWRFDYRRPEGTRNTISLGTYPDVPLKKARERRDEARRQIADGIDPGAKRQAEKTAKSDTFEAIAREWFEKFSPGWAKSHSDKVIRRFERDIFPWLGSHPVSKISAADLLDCLRRIEARGVLETAHRALQNCGQVFRYAVATRRAERDPSADLRGALPPAQGGHFPTITEPEKIGALLRAIDGYQGSYVVRGALQLAPLLFTRPVELRKAEWSEFDLEKPEWRIPAERMKMRELHIVPLSKQAVAVLKELQPLTGDERYVFPSARSKERPLSDNALNAALRRMGFEQGTITVHGFRSMASTLLNEQGWKPDAIERQLAHADRDEIRATYNYAEYLPERRKMMQAWADYLDQLRNSQRVIIGKAA